MVFDKKNIILVKVNDPDLMSFLVDTDLMDDGSYDWRLDDLASEIISVIPEYVFADYIGDTIGITEVIDKIKEAANCIYQVKDYDLMRRYCIENDEEALNQMKDKAYKNKGDFGEVLLHMLLRDFKKTVPLISKVYYKDTANVAAHGFDAVHISPKEKILWLGESKLYGDGKGGLKALCKDLEEHIKRDYLNDQFLIIKKNLENNSIPQRKEWIDILSNCTKMSERLKIINIPMLCIYPDEIYKDIEEELSESLSKRYMQSVKELKDYFDKNVAHSLKGHINIILFLFPIKDKVAFVTKLHEKLWHMQNI